MTAQLLDGKVVATKIRNNVQRRVETHSYKPTLAVCLVGGDPASKIYVTHKQKACEQVGIRSYLQEFPSTTDQKTIVEWIRWCNNAPEISGILVQLPLPEKFNKNFILQQINPLKDVDCFHPENQGLLMSGCPRFKPCTPAGIIELLKHYDIKTKSKNVCIVNRSIVVGQPLATILSQEGDATVTMCHEYTRLASEDLKLSFTSLADIVITAVGKSNYRLTAEMVKDGAIVVDVGIFREDQMIRGDTIFEEVREKASWISKVPGGVGPMTVAMLLSNTVDAMEKS